MSSEADPAAGDPDVDRGPAVAESDSSGVSGQGAEDRGHEAVPADESSASDNNPVPADDDDDDLTSALMAGSLDELDANGEKIKTKDEKKPAAKPAAKPEGEATEEPAAEDEGEKKPEAAEAEFDDADKELLDRARTKAQRKDLERVLKERSSYRKELESAKPAKEFADNVIKHAKEAGVRSDQDLQTILEEHKFLNTAPKEKAAEYLRKLADQYAPQKATAPQVNLDPGAIDDAVAAGFFTEEQGKALKGAVAPPAAEKKPEQQREQQPDPSTTPEAQEKILGDKAMDEITNISKGYQTRLGEATWKHIGAEVKKRLSERLADLRPQAWPKEAKRLIEEVITERKRASVKTPNKTITPRGTIGRQSSEDLSEEEERDLLTKGRL